MHKIVHIYYNTSGNSGLYLNPIYEALKKDYEQILFVNKYYPLEIREFKKIFFSLSERNENNKHRIILRLGKIRKIIRIGELILGNRKVLNYIKKESPDIINYSLTNMPDAYLFLKKIKRISPSSKIVVTCHDVVPFDSTNRIPYGKIYSLVDYLLVHTKNAMQILKNEFDVSLGKIILHQFPIIDLSLLKKNNQRMQGHKIPCFLFLGVMRKEKGVQTLIDAWASLGKNFEANLVIAGFKPDDVNIDFSKIEDFKNVQIINKMISDEAYYNAINSSDYVIFPYLKVGNSGVLSSVVSLEKVPVTTRLKTFDESDFVLSSLQFKLGDAEELAVLITKLKDHHERNYDKYVSHVSSILKKEKKDFSNEVVQAYSRIR